MGPGDEKTVTERGLGMKDHLGGGLATEMDPQDVVRNFKPCVCVFGCSVRLRIGVPALLSLV